LAIDALSEKFVRLIDSALDFARLTEFPEFAFNRSIRMRTLLKPLKPQNARQINTFTLRTELPKTAAAALNGSPMASLPRLEHQRSFASHQKQQLEWTVPLVKLGGADDSKVPSRGELPGDARCLVCAGCGEVVDGSTQLAFECPNAADGNADHVLTVICSYCVLAHKPTPPSNNLFAFSP